jgi:hypothetical protein
VTERQAISPDESDPPLPPGDADSGSSDSDDDAIDEIGEESFPASDSPSTWSGPPTGPR